MSKSRNLSRPLSKAPLLTSEQKFTLFASFVSALVVAVLGFLTTLFATNRAFVQNSFQQEKSAVLASFRDDADDLESTVQLVMRELEREGHVTELAVATLREDMAQQTASASQLLPYSANEEQLKRYVSALADLNSDLSAGMGPEDITQFWGAVSVVVNERDRVLMNEAAIMPSVVKKNS